MRIRMKILSQFLVIFIVVNILSTTLAASNDIKIPASSNNAEIQLAINSGLVPSVIQSNYTKNVTQKELYTLLNNCIKLKTGKFNADWLKKTNAANTKATIDRQNTAVLIYQAALLIGVSFENMFENTTLYFRTDKLDKKLVDSYIKKNNPENVDALPLIYIDVAKNLKEFSQYDFSLNNNNIFYAINYVTGKGDNLSGKKIMELTSDYRFRPRENTTKAEAILAVYRLYNSIDEKPKYVKLENVGANTIPQKLISQKSNLPEATNKKLPQWRGVCINDKAAASTGALFANEDKNFHESEIKFISENGFNFVRVQFSFSTLGFPDYPKDMVNEVELKELDDLIGYGMKYNVHVCICMEGLPEMTKEPFPAEISTGDFFTNTNKQELVKRYWKMISKRYTNIPNKYLSFNLMNEPMPPSDEIHTAVFRPVVEAIWSECPDRVIIADCLSTSCEGLAKMGVALSYHFYSPNRLCYNGLGYMREEYPYLETPKWPMVYLPSLISSTIGCNSIIIEGRFNKARLGIYVYDVSKDIDNLLTITSNEQNIMQEKIIGVEQPGSNFNAVKKEYVIDIPNDATKLELKVVGWLRYGRIQIKQSGKEDINMYPHDLWESDPKAVATKILIHDDGTYENNNSPKKVVDWNYLYQFKIKEHQEVAERNGVGFMIGEFAPFGRLLSKSTLLDYVDTVLNGLKSSGLPWCNGGLIGSGYIANFVPYSDEYTFSKLTDSDLYINKELLSVYKKYTK